MENGFNGSLSEAEVSEHTKNGVVAPTMTIDPDVTIAVSERNKTNHIETQNVSDDNETEIINGEDNSLSSESDALVIDESVPKRQKKSKKKNNQKSVVTSEENGNENSEIVTHSNPYFNESLFELSQLHQEEKLNETCNPDGKSEKTCAKHKAKKSKGKPKPKLEYAQYLGLQPTVQFKCSKCGRAGFESLSTLQEHASHCNEELVQETSPENSYSGFKLTRKVFLCSACGTYYENWNLYMHMLEFHRRFICLYCLGMFSMIEDLCQHIQTRHNLEPGHKNTLDEFFSVYNEPCYVVCCECNRLFSEQDNFFYHNCVVSNRNSKCKKIAAKQHITPENHVTGESDSIVEVNEQVNDKAEAVNMENTSETLPEKQNSEGFASDSNDNVVTQLAGASDKLEEVSRDSVSEKDWEMSKEAEEGSDYHVSDEKECENSQEPTVINSGSVEHQVPEELSKTESVGEKSVENKVVDSISTNSSPRGETSESVEEAPKCPDEDEGKIEEEEVETRKVPKLSLKLPKLSSYVEQDLEDSDDDSEKLTMEVDQIESENENETGTELVPSPSGKEENEDREQEGNDQAKESDEETQQNGEVAIVESSLVVAGSDVPIIELELEQPLDKFDSRVLLQKCLKTTTSTCIYCNHARKIAVNGKQLGLHCIAEHRFSAVVNSITAEELIPESFVNRIKDSLDELDLVFFNLDSSFSGEAVTFSHLFECFQCHFSTTVHKELYLHNRKFHSKNLLLCIMCKSNFYSYSELICHLCPGVYVLDCDVKFRCCMCVNDDLPSSFRLMVHLRKRHNICDVCLETCHTQYRLSNHVWKHKLHHFCYRCGIAYRNKPDITRHLFWKHGTESVLCKKCMQKKWPHVYHFCVPPSSFACDECTLSFTRAVSLKVHKRIHSNEKKWACTFEGCEERFISKKLMEKHEKRHWEPSQESQVEEMVEATTNEEEKVEEKNSEISKEEEEKPKPKIDVLDLPALNLSESDSSDSESEATTKKKEEPAVKSDCLLPDTELEPPGDLPPINILQEDKTGESLPEEENSTTVIQHIWDNFKNYQESKHKLDNMFTEQPEMVIKSPDIPVPVVEEFTAETALRDHDYCIDTEKQADTTLVEVKPALTESVDHDYCFTKSEGTTAEKVLIEPPSGTTTTEETNKTEEEEKKQHSNSNSSSDSDSSSCSCGSNCSCSSSSGGSSSSSSDSSNSDSSTEEGRKKQLARRQKRKERAKKMKEAEGNKIVEVVATDVPSIVETPIRESDLDTTESETDEEFYDEAPQKYAKKLLEEKRQQLLELMGPNNVPSGPFIESTSRPPTPPADVVKEERKKKKSKSKKRKKNKRERREQEQLVATTNVISPDIPIPPYYQQFHQQQQLQQQSPVVSPITLTISRNSPVLTQSAAGGMTPILPSKDANESAFSRRDSSDTNLRASKRRRVPNKFYGYSSDEDQDKLPQHVAKWRKTETPQTPKSPMVVPPITIKTTPQPPVAPPQPTIEPISIRTGLHLSDFRVQRPRPRPTMPPIRLLSRGPDEKDSGSDSNDSSSEEQSDLPPKPVQPQLYCYCQCPYDEVSEMIGCDATDCDIEWFHFECVGIMVPPKGQWFCPDCRKKKARRELMQSTKT